LCGAPAVVAHDPRCRRQLDGPVPGAGGPASWWPVPRRPPKTIERVETELGWEFIQIYGLTETAPLLTMNRAGPSGTTLSPAERAAKLEPGRRTRRSA
jgi:fatty-acyl-CoA synthase